tara:strand:- start:25 stop:573 length:549 start_codon:yes stop_codon:yes gene_type:complete
MPTSQNNKYKNIIHSQNLLISNKDETISLLNERIEKLETQKELNELKQRIGELKKESKELKKQNKEYEEDVIKKSNRLMDMIHKFDKQDEEIDRLKYKLNYKNKCYKELGKVSNELGWKIARHEQQFSKLTNKMLHIPPLFITTKNEGEIVHNLLLTMRDNVEKSNTKIVEFTEEDIKHFEK